MHTKRYVEQYPQLLTPDIVSLLTQIHEYKGGQAQLIESDDEVLAILAENAKIQSVKASCRMAGIATTDERLKKIALDKTMPQTRSEQEIAGYRDVLTDIQENSGYLPPKPSVILQMHRNLYKFCGSALGGSYRASESPLPAKDTAGSTEPYGCQVPAGEVSRAMEQLCQTYEAAATVSEVDPLLLLPLFVLDFLCIHPFSDGSGRMSRLLTLLLLQRAGYLVGKYSSIEWLIEQSRDDYSKALQQSAIDWQAGQNDYRPFVCYTLGVVAADYREVSEQVQALAARGKSKPERIREIIQTHPGAITKAELMAQCPDISLATVQRTLAELQKNDKIIKLGGGRYTAYMWNQERKPC